MKPLLNLYGYDPQFWRARLRWFGFATLGLCLTIGAAVLIKYRPDLVRLGLWLIGLLCLMMMWLALSEMWQSRRLNPWYAAWRARKR